MQQKVFKVCQIRKCLFTGVQSKKIQILYILWALELIVNYGIHSTFINACLKLEQRGEVEKSGSNYLKAKLTYFLFDSAEFVMNEKLICIYVYIL